MLTQILLNEEVDAGARIGQLTTTNRFSSGVGSCRSIFFTSCLQALHNHTYPRGKKMGNAMPRPAQFGQASGDESMDSSPAPDMFDPVSQRSGIRPSVDAKALKPLESRTSTRLWASDILRLRSNLGLSRAEFARFLGVSEATVVRWESDATATEPKGLQAVLLSALYDAAHYHGHESVAQIVRSCGLDHRVALRTLLHAAG